MKKSHACLIALALWATDPGITLAAEARGEVTLLEEISEALCRWYKNGVRDMPLVYLGSQGALHKPGMNLVRTGDGLRKSLDAVSCSELAPLTSRWARVDSPFAAQEFAYAGFLLGVLKELWWIVPSREVVPTGEFEGYRVWLRTTFGFPSDFVRGLTYEDGIVRGDYLGMPVYITNLEELPPLRVPVLLAIDGDFMETLYENPVKESMLDLMGWLIRTLNGKNLSWVEAAVVRGGQLSLKFRYLGTWIWDYLVEPELFADGPPESWKNQQKIEYLDFMLARDDALALGAEQSLADPASPVGWYNNAYIAAERGVVAVAAELLAEAVRRDPGYVGGYRELSVILEGAGRAKEALQLIEKGWRAHPDNVDVGLHLATVLLRTKEAQRSLEVTKALVERNPGSTEVLLFRALSLRSAGRETEAREAMKAFVAAAPPGEWRDSMLQGWENSAAPKSPFPGDGKEEKND